MIERVEGYRFIDTTLRNNTPFMASIPGGLYRIAQTKYPAGVYPDQLYCTFLCLDGQTDTGGGGIKIGVRGLYLITVTGPADQQDNVAAAVTLMDGLIQNAQGTTSTGTIYYFIQTSDFEQNQTISARLVTRLGFQYRTFIQKTGS